MNHPHSKAHKTVNDDPGPGGSSAKTSHRAGSANHQNDSKENNPMADQSTHDSDGEVFEVDPRTGSRPTDPFANPLALVVANRAAHATANPSVDDPVDDLVDSPSDSPVDSEEDDATDVTDAMPDDLVDGPVFDAEVVEDEPAEASTPAPVPGRAVALRRAGVATRRGAVLAYGKTRAGVVHPHTRRSAKFVGRNLVWYPVAGAFVLVKRWRDAHGAGRYERMMRQAEIRGDREMLEEWEARDVAEKQRRHARVMDWVHSPIDLIKAMVAGMFALAGLLLVLGVILAIAHRDIGQVLGPISALIDAIAFTWWFFSVYGATMLLAATVGVVALCWHTGRSHAEPPGWVAATPTGEEDRQVIPDEGAILNALRNLNLAPLNKKFKEGWQPRWVLGTGRDGHGYRTQLELPAGVTVEMINRQKQVLAHNLVRLPVEVWPTEPKKQPGVLDLWVADQGILSRPVEPYPLLEEGETDYFKGVPAGVDQRGDQVRGKLMASNYAIAGIMGSGKTSLVIELLCGAMLDPLVDIEVYVMAYNVDYDPMEPRLATLVKGDDDEQVEAAMRALQGLREEVTVRGQILAELGGDETKVTRELAKKDRRLRPRVVVFDECQELFRHEKYGQQAKELAIKLMMKARKCAITLIFLTPAPSADSLPRDLAKTVSHRVCFAIGDHQGNDAILGTGAHKRGITAVDLVAGEDVGTAMASGFAARPGLIRTHHIRKDKEIDQLTPIVQRSLGGWKGAKKAAGPVKVERDILADSAEVLYGADRLKASDVAARLRELAPEYADYQNLTAEDLASRLGEVGVPVRKLKGVLTVRTGNVLAALADRDENNVGDDDEDAPSVTDSA